VADSTSKREIKPSLAQRLGGLQLRAHSAVEGHYTGIHKSPYHGSSVEFAEFREYSPGDEIKNIDWRVYGKTDRHFVKLTEAETNVNAYIILDASGSMGYGSGDDTRLDYGARLAAALSLLFLRQGDHVGLITFDSAIRDLIPPRGGGRHFNAISQRLEVLEHRSDTALAPVLHQVAEIMRRRSLAIIISDFFDTVDNVLRAFSHFTFKHHEVIAMHLMDDFELDFPFTGPQMFEGMESDRELLADPRIVRQAYMKNLNNFLTAFRQGCHQKGVDYVMMRSSEPFDKALASYLGMRAER